MANLINIFGFLHFSLGHQSKGPGALLTGGIYCWREKVFNLN